MNVSLMWWNTSLSPAIANNKNHNGDIESEAFSMLEHFLHDLRFDLLCLGEVDSDVLGKIENRFAGGSYVVLDRCSRAGNTRFDIGVVYNKEKLEFVDVKDIIKQRGGRTCKVAQLIEFTIDGGNTELFVFASHWPSNLYGNDKGPHASEMRNIIDDIQTSNDIDALIVCMGDFNEEPFQSTLSGALMATRDRSLVRQKKDLLYNPFWKKMGCKSNYHHSNYDEYSIGGSYFHKNNSQCRWYTYDQMIFSSGFIGNTDWHLNEQLTFIWAEDVMASKVLDNKHPFDHFPIVGQIEKVN